MAESEEALSAGEALVRLTQYAKQEHNRELRAYLDKLNSDAPHTPPPSLWLRFTWWIQDLRWGIADGLRVIADKIA